MSMSLRKTVTLGLLAAMSFLLMFFIEFPIPPFPPFLKWDPGDVPAVFATLTLGPVAGIVVELLKAVLFFLSGKSTAGIVGVMANFATGASLVVGVGLAHQALSKLSVPIRFALSSAAGAVSMGFFMGVLNYFIFLPLWGVDQAQLMPMLLGAIVPFNIVKAVITAVISWMAYGALMRRSGIRAFFRSEATAGGKV